MRTPELTTRLKTDDSLSSQFRSLKKLSSKAPTVELNLKDFHKARKGLSKKAETWKSVRHRLPVNLHHSSNILSEPFIETEIEPSVHFAFVPFNRGAIVFSERQSTLLTEAPNCTLRTSLHFCAALKTQFTENNPPTTSQTRAQQI